MVRPLVAAGVGGPVVERVPCSMAFGVASPLDRFSSFYLDPSYNSSERYSVLLYV